VRALDWLYLYLAIGTVVGLIMLPVALLGKRRNGLADSMMDSLHPERTTGWYRFRERVLLPLLIVPAMAIGWPLLGTIAISSMITDRKRGGSSPFKETPEVLAKDLVKMVSQEEAETDGRVVDPLRAVPDLPFGHLNEAWKAFLQQRAEGEELWCYRSDRKDDLSDRAEKSGYAWVKQRKPGAHFRTYYCKRDA
jgi:hypothetical protein